MSIQNDEDYKLAMTKLANFPPVCVGTPEEDIINDLIEDIREYENIHLKFNPAEDEVMFGGDYNR